MVSRAPTIRLLSKPCLSSPLRMMPSGPGQTGRLCSWQLLMHCRMILHRLRRWLLHLRLRRRRRRCRGGVDAVCGPAQEGGRSLRRGERRAQQQRRRHPILLHVDGEDHVPHLVHHLLQHCQPVIQRPPKLGIVVLRARRC